MPPPNTPAEPVGARVARFPTAGSLPRFNGGSASALCVSRPARRLLALWPVWLLSRPRRPFVIGVLQTMLLPLSSAPIATDWSDSCRAGFAPAEDWRLLTAHVEMPPYWGPGLGTRGTELTFPLNAELCLLGKFEDCPSRLHIGSTTVAQINTRSALGCTRFVYSVAEDFSWIDPGGAVGNKEAFCEYTKRTTSGEADELGG